MKRIIESLVFIAIGAVIVKTNIELGVTGPKAVLAITACTFFVGAAFELALRFFEKGGDTK